MRDLDSVQSQMEQEVAIKQIILARLRRTTIVQAPQQEAVAYRLADIFVAARQLYTDVLPGFLEMPEAQQESEAEDAIAPSEGAESAGRSTEALDDRTFELFGEVRMNLLHLSDLLEDFEETFLESLSGRLQNQEDQEEEGDDDDT